MAVIVVATDTTAVLVRLNDADVATPETLAVTEYVPVVTLAVKVGAVAMPLLLVVSVTEVLSPENVPLAPLEGAAKVTVTPLIALPFWSLTVASSAVANAVLTVALWGVPTVAVMVVATDCAALLVRRNEAEVPMPVTPAVTEYVPVVALAVKVGAVAMPLLLVVSVTEVLLPENVPLAPLNGAAKVTVTPLSGLPF